MRDVLLKEDIKTFNINLSNSVNLDIVDSQAVVSIARL